MNLVFLVFPEFVVKMDCLVSKVLLGFQEKEDWTDLQVPQVFLVVMVVLVPQVFLVQQVLLLQVLLELQEKLDSLVFQVLLVNLAVLDFLDLQVVLDFPDSLVLSEMLDILDHLVFLVLLENLVLLVLLVVPDTLVFLDYLVVLVSLVDGLHQEDLLSPSTLKQPKFLNVLLEPLNCGPVILSSMSKETAELLVKILVLLDLVFLNSTQCHSCSVTLRRLATLAVVMIILSGSLLARE